MATSVDEGLYSRQLYVLGKDVMEKMAETDVLIVGCDGLGAEIAKNVVLAGVRSVTISDTETVRMSDLSSQFFLSEAHVGKNRAACTLEELQELNPYVSVVAHEGACGDEFLSQFKTVVVCGAASLEELIRINNITHSKGNAFIATGSHGVVGYIFCDFGEEHLVADTTGEEPLSAIVVSISKENPGIVTVHDEKPLEFASGGYVTFSEVEGMEEINGKVFSIDVLSPYTFSIGDTTKFGTYTGGGLVKEVKMPTTLHFNPLRESIVRPIVASGKEKGKNLPHEFLIPDFAKIDRPLQLHFLLRGLFSFRAEKGRLPAPGNEEEASEVLRITKNLVVQHNAGLAPEDKALEVSPLDETTLKRLVLHVAGDISPMASFLGGIVAQEVLKSCSAKFTPIHQWFHFDALECLQKETLRPEEYTPTGSRYDGQIAVFGKSLHAKLMDLTYFLVGAGALGCEFLKGFALMGVGCGRNGLIHVTDMDNIEKSNLNRQFLFRDQHVGQMKSTVAAMSAQKMNPALRIQAYTTVVCPDTEESLDDEFWDSLDGVCNALDNIEARLYVDKRCVFFHKPLLESGTLSTKANVQVVVPHLTESYGSSADPDTKDIPMCTLKNFPYAIEHCVEWARDLFGGLFVNSAEETNTYLRNFTNKAAFIDAIRSKRENAAQLRARLESIEEALTCVKSANFEECVAWARLKFEELFHDQIVQLLFNYPHDAKNAQGNLFWSAPKRAPSPVKFDANDPLHLMFVLTAANIRAYNFGITTFAPESIDQTFFKANKLDVSEENVPNVPTNVKWFAQKAQAVPIPEFTPKAGVHIQETEDQEVTEGSDDDEEIIARILEKLPEPSEFAQYRMNVAKFEKDNDANFHIDFITATSNLRARNYTIVETDRLKTKQLAGRIMPAIATTTAMVTGLVLMELYKIVQSKPLEEFKNSFINLALPLFAFSEPIRPAKAVADPYLGGRVLPEGFTLWDTMVVEGGRGMTIQGLLDWFKDTHDLTCDSISSGRSSLYRLGLKSHLDRLGKTVVEVWEDLNKKKLSEKKSRLDLEVTCTDAEGESVTLPTIILKLRV